jgi:hypothetical protein
MTKIFAAGLSLLAGGIALAIWNAKKSTSGTSSNSVPVANNPPIAIDTSGPTMTEPWGTGTLYWRSDLATKILQQIFNAQYQKDSTYKPPVLHYVKSPNTQFDPKTLGTPISGASLIKSGYTSYLVTDAIGNELWIADATYLTSLAGTRQSNFAVIAGPGQAQAVIGSDPAYDLMKVTSAS